MLSDKTTISEGGWGQVCCFWVGMRSTSVIVLSFLLEEEDCSGGCGPLGGLSSTTTGNGSVPLPSFDSSLVLGSGAAEKLYWFDEGLPSSLNRRLGESRFSSLSFLTYRMTVPRSIPILRAIVW